MPPINQFLLVFAVPRYIFEMFIKRQLVLNDKFAFEGFLKRAFSRARFFLYQASGFSTTTNSNSFFGPLLLCRKAWCVALPIAGILSSRT